MAKILPLFKRDPSKIKGAIAGDIEALRKQVEGITGQTPGLEAIKAKDSRRVFWQQPPEKKE